MREIKFRQFYDGGVHYWGYENLSESKNPVFTGPVLGQRVFIESQQYTGLKDSNGVEIYEGDIVRVWNGNKAIIGHDGFQFCVGKKYRPMQSYEASDMKVIGNIYQNPELLK